MATLKTESCDDLSMYLGTFGVGHLGMNKNHWQFGWQFQTIMDEARSANVQLAVTGNQTFIVCWEMRHFKWIFQWEHDLFRGGFLIAILNYQKDPKGTISRNYAR